MKKRAALLLVGTLVLSTILSACGNSGNSGNGSSTDKGSGTSTASEEQIKLTFSWWGSETRHEAMQKIVALYEEENPKVKIEVEYGAWDGWGSKILTQLSGGTEADIMQVNYNWIHSYGNGKNVFYDMNQLKDNIDLSNWDQQYLGAMTTADGQLGAVPWGMTGRVQLENSKLFEDAGLEFPATYQEVISQGAVIGANNSPTGQGNKYVLMNVGPESTDLFIAQMLLNKTGKVMQTDGKINYSVEDVTKVLELYKAMEDSGAMPTFQQDNEIQNESNPDWTGGRVGAVYEWTSSLEKYVTSFMGGEAKDQLTIGAYLSDGNREPVIYVKPNLGYAISKTSRHPEAAADFINFMFTNEKAVEAMNTQLGISSNAVTIKYQEGFGMIDGITREALDMLASYEQVVMDPYFEDGNIRGERYTAIEAFRTGSMNAATAAKDYVEKQQAALDELYGL